jgi:Uroporphyrinogen decarboxylase (URO-D)
MDVLEILHLRERYVKRIQSILIRDIEIEHQMNSRERFLRILSLKMADRPPLFEDGIRDDVLKQWHKQGLRKYEKLESAFIFDHREEIEPILEPIPAPTRWPKRMDGLEKLKKRLNANNLQRLPEGWEKSVYEWKKRDYPVILRIHRGFFLTMGVYRWQRFMDTIELLVDDPVLVETWMDAYSQFVCQLAERILSEVEVDAALFSEPIGGNNGPLISPSMYSSLVLKSYLPIIEVLKSYGVNSIIYRTYANTRTLLPSVVRAGFNCLWACESDPLSMNYRKIRQEFGKDLCLIGGIDSDYLRGTQEDIYRAIMEVVPPLLADGGYIPLADGRVREDVPYQNYAYYRNLLEDLVGAK